MIVVRIICLRLKPESHACLVLNVPVDESFALWLSKRHYSKSLHSHEEEYRRQKSLRALSLFAPNSTCIFWLWLTPAARPFYAPRKNTTDRKSLKLSQLTLFLPTPTFTIWLWLMPYDFIRQGRHLGPRKAKIQESSFWYSRFSFSRSKTWITLPRIYSTENDCEVNRRMDANFVFGYTTPEKHR